jgi:hypothetical protein
MKYSILILLFLSTLFSSAQKTIETKSTLKEVTVFLKGAQLTRYAQTDIQSGTSIIKVAGLSPYLDRKTIQVKGIGSFTVLSIRHQLNYLNEKKLDALFTGLNDSIEKTTILIEDMQNDIAILTEKETFLRTNQNIKGNDNLDPEKFEAINAFYGDQITLIRNDKFKKSRKIKDYQATLVRLRNQLAQEQKNKHDAESEIYVEINASKSQKAEFVISYLVIHAAWFPTYDIRVNKIDEPLQLVYKANISQTTGENWTDVQLTISNANPYVSGDLPELKPWYLNFGSNAGYYKKGRADQEYSLNSYISNSSGEINGRIQNSLGEPLVGATIRIAGTSIGAVSDMDGNFNISLPEGNNQIQVNYIGHNDWSGSAVNGQFLNVRMAENANQMQEVVMQRNKSQNAPAVSWSSNANQMYYDAGNSFKAAAAPIVHRLENQANLQITIELPYTVESNGKLKTVEINDEKLNAYYEYRAVPKLEKAAFLVAKVDDWARLNLLEGEANLYFENTYVGKTVLDVRFLSDTLNISLGRDRNVIVSRMKVKSFSTSEFIGSDRIEKRSFEIKIRNNKKENINVVVYDQIPVSNNKDIAVSLKESGGAINDEKTGELKWMLTAPSSTTKEIKFDYQVKFPKNKDLQLE